MGSVIKVVATYERPFWREAGFSGEAVSDTGPIRLCFDDCGPDGHHPALVGFFLGETARAWTGRPAEERRRAALDCFARFFGPQALRPTAIADLDWPAEPWSKGCYVGVPRPGTLTAIGDALRAPFGRVHWAGTETAVEGCGYIDGAVESGERAGTLGGYAEGTIRLAAKNSELPEYDLQAVDGDSHVRALVDRFARYGASIRNGIHRADEVNDPVTADLLTQSLGAVELDMWFLESHLHGDVRAGVRRDDASGVDAGTPTPNA
jgi:DNA-binding ferritin-like protein